MPPPFDQRRQGSGTISESLETESDEPTKNETQNEIEDPAMETSSSQHRAQPGENAPSLPSDIEGDCEHEYESIGTPLQNSRLESLGSSENPHVIVSEVSSNSSSDSPDNEDDRDSQPDSLHEFQQHSLSGASSPTNSQYRRTHEQLLADSQSNTQMINESHKEYLPDSPTRVNGIEPTSLEQHHDAGDLLLDTQVNSLGVGQHSSDNSGSPTQVNQTEANSPHFSHGDDDLLPDTQVNSQRFDTSCDDGSGSPTQMNTVDMHIATKKYNTDDDLPDTQINSQSSNHFTNHTHTYSAVPKSMITNHFSSTKSSSFGTSPPDSKPGASSNHANHSDQYLNSTISDADLPDTQMNHVEDTIPSDLKSITVVRGDGLLKMQSCLPTKPLMTRDEDLLDTQMGSSQPFDNQQSMLEAQLSLAPTSDTEYTEQTSKTTEHSFQATQSNTPSSSFQVPNRILSQSFTDDDDLDTQASIAPTLFRRQSTAASIASFKSDLSTPLSKAEKSPLNKISCRERKRIVTSYNCPPSLMKAMKQWIRKTHNLLDPFREDDDCWFHPSPPAARVTASGLRPVGKLQKCFIWQEHRGRHTLVLNYGIVSKIVNYKMTKQQKDGFINKQWHLSHLCGNWTCLNPAHTTVEPGSINISRNNCFSHRSGCHHDPKCMKDKKVSLAPDGKPVNRNSSYTMGEATQQAVDNWDDWSMQSFDDGEISICIDDQDETEFALHGEDEDDNAPVGEENGGAD